MSKNIKTWIIYSLSAIYLALSLYLIVEKDSYAALLIPVALIMVWLFFYSLENIYFLIVLFTPLAVSLSDTDVGIGISLPTEPLLFGLMIFFTFRILYDNPYDKKLLYHPLTKAIIFDLLWMILTCMTSEYPLVSFKYLISRLWFVIPCYFFAYHLFLNGDNIKKFFYLYGIGMLITIIYTLINHYSYGFDQKSGHWVMRPFYNDHTQYGAILAMFIPIFGGLSINKSLPKYIKIACLFFTAFLIVAIIFSYCRAAWVGLAVSLCFMLIVLFKIKFKYVFVSIFVILGFLYGFKDQIIYKLEKNTQDSSTNFVEHIKSIYNISSDASNLERINRWESAINMFKERPILGWGPGTYQFCYAPFQSSKNKTIISTNAGDAGNAHSEYIGPLAESGILGPLLFILIAVLSVYYGYKTYKKSDSRDIKITVLSVTMALISYYAHGFLNNFLDSDKASVPFWSFLAIIVALNVSTCKKKQKYNSEI